MEINNDQTEIPARIKNYFILEKALVDLIEIYYGSGMPKIELADPEVIKAVDSLKADAALETHSYTSIHTESYSATSPSISFPTFFNPASIPESTTSLAINNGDFTPAQLQILLPRGFAVDGEEIKSLRGLGFNNEEIIKIVNKISPLDEPKKTLDHIIKSLNDLHQYGYTTNQLFKLATAQNKALILNSLRVHDSFLKQNKFTTEQMTEFMTCRSNSHLLISSIVSNYDKLKNDFTQEEIISRASNSNNLNAIATSLDFLKKHFTIHQIKAITKNDADKRITKLSDWPSIKNVMQIQEQNWTMNFKAIMVNIWTQNNSASTANARTNQDTSKKSNSKYQPIKRRAEDDETEKLPGSRLKYG